LAPGRTVLELAGQSVRRTVGPIGTYGYQGSASTASWLDVGVEQHRIEGRPVRVYSIARTVADCFRFRNTVGLDVALEALSDAWRGRGLDLDELNRVAKRLRVQRVMLPYLQAVVL
jgi:hypothetical protein